MIEERQDYDPLASLSSRLDYLQGVWTGSQPIDPASGLTVPTPGAVREVAIAAIGATDKDAMSRAEYRKGWETATRDKQSPMWLPASTDLVVGLHGRSSIALLVLNLEGRLEIRMGVWSASAAPRDLDLRRHTLLSLLRSCYVNVRDAPAGDTLGGATHGGYVVGVPHPPIPRRSDPATPWDRMIRSLTGERWGAVVLAQPIQDSTRLRLRDQLLNESRLINSFQTAENRRHPLVETYLERLKAEIEAHTTAGAVGAWRTAVYLLGDYAGYERLSAVWRGLFAGADAGGLPLRVHADPSAVALARDWGLPDKAGPDAPGAFRFPFFHQTVLTSQQLAAYVHLPEQEHPGYAVEQVVSFDSTARPFHGAEALELGKVIDRTRVTNDSYQIDTPSLTKHVFVCGVTGQGKTNTILVLLDAARRAGKKFLVLEPAKREYRSMLSLPGFEGQLQVFTAGDETSAPLRVNPLEVPPGTTVATHLDLVRSLFSAAFEMWEPLPQLLERALHRSYADRGWDVTANTNGRLDPGADRRTAYPTLSDLADHAEEVVRESGYDPEAMGRIRGALGAAIGGLRAGGKGRMFDTNGSLSSEDLFDNNVVIEMESLGDEADKAFLMGLILIRLYEHRRAQGEQEGLRHLVVVEEAHRLLSNKSPGGAGKQSGDPAGKAVETFTNLLAEVRAYGQGLVIADQVPSRLAPEVLKNTNLKIAHRLVAEDDRRAMGAAMVMTEAQSRALATFTRGRAAVFAEGEDAPVLIEVNPATRGDISSQELDSAVTSQGRRWDTKTACCGVGDPAVCERGRNAAASDGFRSVVNRIAVTLTASPGIALDVLPSLEIELEAGLASTNGDESARQARASMLWHGADYLGRRRGAQWRWTYGQTQTYTDLLYRALTVCVEPGADAAEPVRAFQEFSRRLHERSHAPYPRCNDICPDQTCVFRWPVVDALSDPEIGRDLQSTIAGGGEEVTFAAQRAAAWLTVMPLEDTASSDSTLAKRAHAAATRCLAQSAVVKMRPWPSLSTHIDVVLEAIDHFEAGAWPTEAE